MAGLSSLGLDSVGLHLFPPGHLRLKEETAQVVESSLQAGGAGWRLPMCAGLLLLTNNAACTRGVGNLGGCLGGLTQQVMHKVHNYDQGWVLTIGMVLTADCWQRALSEASPLDPHSLCTGLMGQPQPWMGGSLCSEPRVPSSPPCILSKSGQLLANHSR